MVRNPNVNTNPNTNSDTNAVNYESAPPRPYLWKTDEFQVLDTQTRKSKTIKQVQPLANPYAAPQMPPPQPLAFQQPQHLAFGYQCPRCASRLLPKVVRRISTAGWIVFAALMVTFFPLFWIGLLIKEDVRICTICNAKIG